MQYRSFVLGCTVLAVGLNFASYLYYPYEAVNSVWLDPIRRSALWALYGSGVGVILGHLLFGLYPGGR